MIMITSETRHDNGRISVTMTSGKKEAAISYLDGCGINVLCVNASHRAYRGLGRTFTSWADAKAAYKSADMRAMIEHAEELASAS